MGFSMNLPLNEELGAPDEFPVVRGGLNKDVKVRVVSRSDLSILKFLQANKGSSLGTTKDALFPLLHDQDTLSGLDDFRFGELIVG